MQVLPLTTLRSENVVHLRPSIDIFSRGAGVQSKRGYTHSCEAIAIQTLSEKLHKLPVELRLDYSTPIVDLDSARIVFGLSRSKNQLSTALLDKIGTESGVSLIKGAGAHQFFRDKKGIEYHCSHVEDLEYETRVTKDYGIIYRTVGDSGGALLLCGGIHMFGTQAAVQVALSDAFIQRVRKSRSEAFVQLVEVCVQDDGVMIDLDSVRWRSLPFVPISKKSHRVRA